MILDKTKTLDMIPNPKQREALRAFRDTSKQYFLLDGGIRSGKTEFLFSWLVARAIAYPGSKQIVIRKETAQHKRGFWGHGGTIHRYLYKTLEMSGLAHLYTLRESDMKVVFTNGSLISLEGVDTPQNIGRIYGDEYITIWFNEAWMMDYDVVTALWDRTTQKCYAHPIVAGARKQGFPVEANKQVIFDTNPRGKRHWLYKIGVLGLDPTTGEVLKSADKWARISGWSPYVNSANVNTDGMENQTGVSKARNIDGEWCDTEGAVYEEFDENIHVCKDCDGTRCKRVFNENGMPIARRLMRGVDFGFKDPTVCLWFAEMGGQLLVYRCYYKTRVRSDLNATAIKALESPHERFAWTVADHAPDHIAQFKKCGIKCKNAKKDNPIMAGVQRVKKRLHAPDGIPGLKICQFCTPVIDEMSSLMMDKNKDEPEGKNDHCPDVIRYVIAEVDGKVKSQAFYI